MPGSILLGFAGGSRNARARRRSPISIRAGLCGRPPLPTPIGSFIRSRATPGRSSGRSDPLQKNGEAMAKVEFHFDFGSPNAYLAHRVIPQIERRTSAKFDYVPVLLGGVFKLTGNRSPAESLAGIKNKPEYARLETARFIARHRIDGFRPNPFFPVNTLTIMRGAVAAERLGVFARYVD